MMRRFFNFFLALVAVVAVSCEGGNNSETNNEPKPEPIFTILTDEINYVAAEGDDVMVRYSIENPVEGVEIKSQVLNTDMIAAVDCSVDNVVKISILPNPTTEKREGTVILSYNNHNYNIIIKQEASPYEVVNIAANQLIGTYYGDKLVEGLGYYWLIFSKDGIVDGDVQPNTEFIRLDILAPMPEDMTHITAPDGTYVFDSTNQYAEFSILNLPNTDYMWVDENLEGWSTPLEDATMVIEGNHIEVVAYAGNKKFVLSYDGDYSLEVPKVSDCITTLTSDLTIDVSDCDVEFKSHGDYWHCGYCNWVVEFIDKAGFMRGKYIVLDLLGTTADASSGYVGVYRSAGFSEDDPKKPNFGPGVFVPCTPISDDGVYMQGSMYMVYNSEGKAVEQVPFTTGTIEIKDNGNGTQTIIVDVYDDAPKPNHITLNWTGRLE